MQISDYAPTLAALQKLSLERQSQLFLAQLAVLYCCTNGTRITVRYTREISGCGEIPDNAYFGTLD